MKLHGKTNEQLVALIRAIEADPKNRMPPGKLYMYTSSARRKLHALAWAITQNIIDAKKAAGTYVETSGYSGRNSNRR